MKQEKKIERVYEPRRLLWAWQQIRSNAGAAGIDGMTVEAFERRAGELLQFFTRLLLAPSKTEDSHPQIGGTYSGR